MSLQRRRGPTALVWCSVPRTDNRGNVHLVPDRDHPVSTSAWVVPGRSAKAEVPGQLGINIIQLGLAVKPALERMDLWSEVLFQGRMWDIAAPPAYHHGTRHTRHYTVQLRERP